MRLHVFILALALLATGAFSATITLKQDNFDKKLIQVVNEELSKDETSQQSDPQVIEESNVVKDVQNNLRKGEINNIPVQVVADDVKLNNEVEEDNIKRPEIDLNNPGEPQHQEHNSQQSGSFNDQQSLLALIRQNVIETQNVFNNGLQQFQTNLQNWWQNNQQIIQIQQNLQELQQNFQTSIDRFNQTVQNYYPPQGANPVQPVSGSESKETVESAMNALKNSFEGGVQSISADVKSISSGKQDGSSSTTGGSTGGFPGFGSGPFASYFQQLQNQIQSGFQNMTNTFQNYFQNFNQTAGGSNSSDSGNIFQNWGQNVQNFINQQQGNNQPAGAQSDEAQTNRPTIWTGIQSIFNPQNGQNIQNDPVNQPQPNRPIVQAIQNNPIVQGFVGLINRPGNKPEDPKPSGDKPEATQGVNVVPVVPVDKPEKKPEIIAYAQSGPIRQILIEKNPVAQGLVGMAQRIQSAALNPVKPRDTVQNDQKQVSEVKGHKPGGGGSDTSNSDSGVKKESQIKEEEEESQPQKTES